MCVFHLLSRERNRYFSSIIFTEASLQKHQTNAKLAPCIKIAVLSLKKHDYGDNEDMITHLISSAGC